MIRILAIGNSFSQDALRYLKFMADSVGAEIKTINLYLPMCTLEDHAKNVQENLCRYTYECNGVQTGRIVSVQEVLQEEPWDVVTIQQTGGKSGLPDTYEPHGDVLLSCIRQYAPQAKIYFHMTWAYEIDCTDEQFSNYGYSQQTMYRMLSDTVHTFADAKEIDVIPVGTVIQAVRTLPAFDYANGGISLCRDGRHLSFQYGRYIAAAVWLETVLGINILDVSFAPRGTTPELIEQVRTVVHKCCTQETN